MRRFGFLSSFIALVVGLVVAQLPGVALAAPDRASAPGDSWRHGLIEPALQEQLDAGGTVRFVVEYTADADLADAADMSDSAARGQFVFDALRATAESSQQEVLDLAREHGAVATGYWIRNVVVVEGDKALAEAIAELDGVSKLRLEDTYPLVEPVPGDEVIDVAAADPEWGVDRIGADEVWSTLGITGTGVTVASIDTGVDYTHPALVNQYRGNLGGGTFDHNYNWWDPSNVCGPVPCDNIAHGTHTMGTILGGDGPGPFTPDIGVAPGAKWMTAKGCEFDSCSESALLSSGQWVVAPTNLAGANPDPSRRPQIVNNSWGGGPGDPFYVDIVRAWRAAGIIPVFSSGNPGPFCGFGGSPADYLESFSVGATDINDAIYVNSGRGESVFGKVNPDVTAPGVNVSSSVPGGGYSAFTGTSMASPHVTGTFALMMSAEPSLVGDFETSADTVRSTAMDIIDTSCGGDTDGDPNNVFGDGRIDALAAVSLVASSGVLEGTVTAGPVGAPIAGATITATGGGREASAVSDADGHYELTLVADTYTVVVSAFAYETATYPNVVIVTDQTTVQDAPLVALPAFTVSGRVTYAESGAAAVGATVRPFLTPAITTSDSRGRYSLSLPAGMYILETTVGGCTNPGYAFVHVDGNETLNLTVTRKIDAFGHGCRAITPNWTDARTSTALFGDDVYGRLTLPFEFPFYNETYSSVYVGSNGFLSFVDPESAAPSPGGIPAVEPPNAAIYPLWTDLVVDEDAHVDYHSRSNVFVVEFDNLASADGSARVDFEVKLYPDGRIDTLYRDNAGAPGDGSGATIGIEDPDGTDALQFSDREARVQPDVAYRYEVVGTGVVSGVVSNANDGDPVAGATVTAQPGGRTATTGEDGTYSLRLVSGSYQVSATAPGYGTTTEPLTIGTNQTKTLDLAMPASQSEVTPELIEVTTPAGTPATATVTVANTGTQPLTFEAEERDTTPRAAAADAGAEAAVAEGPTVPWGPVDAPAVSDAAAATTEVAPTADLPADPIIDDPDDDGFGGVEITEVFGGADTETMTMAIDFSDTTALPFVYGYVFFDTDQNRSTGLPPAALFGKDTQEVGVDYYADLFGVSSGTVRIIDQNGFQVGSVPATFEGQRLLFTVPLTVLGGDDGDVDTAMVLGDAFGPTDWAPDVGKGTIEAVRDAAWMTVAPLAGTVAPGDSTSVTLTLGGPGFAPGTYTAQLVFATNDPRNPTRVVEVRLTIT